VLAQRAGRVGSRSCPRRHERGVKRALTDLNGRFYDAFVSQSLRILKAAVREFVNRPPEEDIDPNEVLEVVNQLEAEVEKLYESVEEHAAGDEALAKAIRMISETYGPRS
jgi:hypothetical protein